MKRPPLAVLIPISAVVCTMASEWVLKGVGSFKAAEATETTDHWAYIVPTRPALPDVSDSGWSRNTVDTFILARLETAGLQPNPEAERTRLIRRVSLDLLGLPPQPDRVDAFISDPRPDAYEILVDEVLASPQYGERWTRSWLDLARYADSNGFQRDGHRTVWPYRDWVVDAFNSDLPFDRFTVEQLAGDLLPEATVTQRIATGFHRSTTVNVEAGTDSEENRVKAVLDRVNTTATVWLGTTLECAQCHDHKYDPFSQTDYYRLLAYFNNTAIETIEAGSGAGRQFIGPWVKLPQTEREAALLADTEAALAAAEAAQKTVRETELAKIAEWEHALRADSEKLAAVSQDVREALNAASEGRSAEQKKTLKRQFLGDNPAYQAATQVTEKYREEVERRRPNSSLVMVELETPRETRVFERGNFLQPRESVGPGTPATLHRQRNDALPNRLGLAEWLVDEQNPLVARVAVNRAWAELFGRGLVASIEDFGVRGTRPSHPQLLDWLATEWVSRGWSRKWLHRLLVTSATYRQNVKVTERHKEHDPNNELYSRGARFRLSAEAIRDNALAASGLLSLDMGGPPVRPRQPEGIWTVIGNVDNTYRTSVGRDLYRRSLYTVWRRSSPYPSLVNFDAPSRATICVKRARTNTPIQALTLLNDPVYVELALALGERVLAERAGEELEAQITYAFRLCLARTPHGDEVRSLRGIYEQQLARLADDPEAARELMTEHPQKDSAPTWTDAEVARRGAWFYVATVLLNLDEFVNKG
jgi:hypothetical protein